jgi:hypothetical protein
MGVYKNSPARLLTSHLRLHPLGLQQPRQGQRLRPGHTLRRGRIPLRDHGRRRDEGWVAAAAGTWFRRRAETSFANNRQFRFN